MTNTDPYPAVGSNYRPNFQPSTTNRSITLTQEEIEALKLITHTLPPSVLEKVNRLYVFGEAAKVMKNACLQILSLVRFSHL